MALDPEELLSCIERMTVLQKARFCELIDPVPGRDRECERRAPVFQPPGPKTVAWFLGGWKGEPPPGCVTMSDEVFEVVPEIELPDPEPSTLTDAGCQERWALAQRRWTQLFHEPKIPMPLADEIVSVALDAIEGMLYDKGVKNQDPVRCACGCGYVIGCVGNKYPSCVKDH